MRNARILEHPKFRSVKNPLFLFPNQIKEIKEISASKGRRKRVRVYVFKVGGYPLLTSFISITLCKMLQVGKEQSDD